MNFSYPFARPILILSIILLETNFNDDFLNEELFDSRYIVSVCLPPNYNAALYEMHMSSVESFFENCDSNDYFFFI
jgi:hypothetical protein